MTRRYALATISGSASRIGCPSVPASQEHRTTACLSMPCRYRAGIPWRDLLARFGDFQVARLHHSCWSHSGVWQRIFEALAQQADNEYAMIGSTIVRAPPARCRDKRGSAASHRTQPQRAERQDSRSGGCTGPPDFISRQGGERPRRGRRALGSNSGRNRDHQQGL